VPVAAAVAAAAAADSGVRSSDTSVRVPAASPAKRRVPSWSKARQLIGTSDT
jgi:hypothetical protein